MTRRRTRGEGGLYQRHDHMTCPPLDADGNRPAHKCRGRWVANVEVIVDGKRRRKSIYARTSREARMKLAKALREKEDGTLVVASMTVEKWLNYWLDNIAARSIRPQTMRGYRSKIDQYLIPQLGRRRLTDLQPEHIRAMHDWMRRQGLAEASVRQAHVILKRALRVAVDEGKLGANPADRMESPGTETAKRRALTLDQAQAVLRHAGDDARWWLALFYGMRQGEVLGLRWCDIDFDRATIRVEQSLQTSEDGALIFGPPKSKASRRTIPILPQVDVRLRLLHECAGSPTDDRLVFHHEGRPIQPKADWKAWSALLVAATVPPWAPIPHVALHAARNTAASLMEAAGIPDRLVAQILGQSQVRVTHGYQHAEIARERAALDQLGRLLELE